LLPGGHKRAARGHPWIYSNEIKMDDAARALEPGIMARFHSHDGTFIGTGSFNPRSLIAGRIFTRVRAESMDVPWFESRLKNALRLRESLFPEPFYRLVHAEADGLPGLIVDRFGPHLGVQLNTAGMQRLWPEIEAALAAQLKPETIILHNDSHVRTFEGLERMVTFALGLIKEPVEIAENGIVYFADIAGGQKTGWYFDQRCNRALVARHAKGKRVLDLYCHSGGFGLLAAKEGAVEVVGVDSSEPALKLARMAAERNGLTKRMTWHREDVFDELEKLAAAKEKFDIVIADPPPFVKSRKDLAGGSRGYRKLARLAARMVSEGGLLFMASCSHNMPLDAFIGETARGLHEAGRGGRILYTVFAAPDHPVHPQLPESGYLKGVMLKLD
jgi:23S rRNA (cytosine1962-C5)-methyltransferase